jgi:hypothetical protein
MKKSKFSVSQIVIILKQAKQNGLKVLQIFQENRERLGITEPCYN